MKSISYLTRRSLRSPNRNLYIGTLLQSKDETPQFMRNNWALSMFSLGIPFVVGVNCFTVGLGLRLMIISTGYQRVIGACAFCTLFVFAYIFYLRLIQTHLRIPLTALFWVNLANFGCVFGEPEGAEGTSEDDDVEGGLRAKARKQKQKQNREQLRGVEFAQRGRKRRSSSGSREISENAPLGIGI